MIHAIYSQKLDEIFFEIVLLPVIWIIINRYQRKGVHRAKTWVYANYALLFASLAGIIYLTVYGREPNVKGTFYPLFYTFDQSWSNMYLTKLFFLNILLFVPFGTSLSSLLQGNKKDAKAVIITIVAGFAISTAVELAQFLFGLGQGEADDILANTVGSAIGACNLLLLPFANKVGDYLHKVTEHD